MKKKSIRLTLRPHEKLFLNGAVLQVDRKTTLELLNDATFMLEAHVLQADDTDTPLKQLYFAAQMMLIDPANGQQARDVFLDLLGKLLRIITDKTILGGLRDCIDMAGQGRIFDILKIIRGLFPHEAEILGKPPAENSNAGPRAR